MRQLRGAILAIAVLAGGCSGPAPTPTAFQVRANRICAESAKRIEHLAMPRGAHAREGYVAAYVSELRDELQRLQKLGYPHGARPQLQAIYNQLQSALTRAQAQPLSFDPSQLTQQNRALWREGLTACRT